jgi:hypothetical protein
VGVIGDNLRSVQPGSAQARQLRDVLIRQDFRDYEEIRNEARFFREIDLLQLDRLAELPDKLRALSAARNELNQKSPSIPRRAFVAARKGIEEGEATHKVDQGA